MSDKVFSLWKCDRCTDGCTIIIPSGCFAIDCPLGITDESKWKKIIDYLKLKEEK